MTSQEARRAAGAVLQEAFRELVLGDATADLDAWLDPLPRDELEQVYQAILTFAVATVEHLARATQKCPGCLIAAANGVVPPSHEHLEQG